ncbi:MULTISPECIES: AP2/ERF family transcription factor [Aeromonas]|uniref:AP2 domain-containing protein n=1 Tax=Aeromonas veronii TaxID=654 RepID=A0A4S5CPJ5_AERVE|nr:MULTISPECIES: AP2/ERF family transcription factor [Aeromonas]THJ45106.1 AP2 domain-containing protein [Aeromonas veronii]
MSPFGKYISLTGTTLMVRVPGDRQRNYPIRHARAAMAARDAIAASFGLTVTLQNERGRKTRRANKSKLSIGLPSGVSFCESHQAFGVVWREGPVGSRTTRFKSFSISTYGTEAQARRLAIEWRAHMEVLHYDDVKNKPVDV